MAVVLLGIAGATIATGVVVSAHQVLSWVLACAISAALIELLVQALDRFLQRAIAIVLVLAAIVSLGGFLTFVVFHDLDHEVHRFRAAAPVAAAQLEHSRRVGKLAREIDLSTRVQAAVDRLSAPSSGLAGRAVSSIGTYTICAILIVLFLSWGPRVLGAAADQLPPVRAAQLREQARIAFPRARRYVTLSLTQSAVVGLIGWIAADQADLPAPAPLALALATMALIPYIGILLGSLPLLLFAGGLSPTNSAPWLIAVFLGLQVLSSQVVQKLIVRTSNLYVGPSVITITFLAGFELYGVGGAFYASALAIMGVAMLDTHAERSATDQSETERLLRVGAARGSEGDPSTAPPTGHAD